jgi:RHS repeat-associated protein
MRAGYVAALVLPFLALSALAQHPNVARGFHADKVYQFNGVDNINLYNGNLTVTVPLGPEYIGNGRLKYRFALVYNSQAWDREIHSYEGNGDCSGGQPPEWCGRQYVKAIPSKRSNAGMGWSLTLGRLMSPSDPATYPGPFGDGSFAWTYESPDGADHEFTLPDTQNASVLHTTDGSFLRLVPISSSREVHFPDGSIHTFAPVGNTYRLEKIQDAFGNRLSLTYQTDQWTLTEYSATGATVRTHYVNLKDITEGPNPGIPSDAPPNYDFVVDSVDLAAFNGSRAEYSLVYTTDLISYGCYSDFRGVETPRPRVPRLTKVLQPDESPWEFSYYFDGCSSMKDLTLPTKGRSEFTYTGRSIPVNGCRSWEIVDGDPREAVFSAFESVHKKTVFPGDGSSAQWTYEQTPALSYTEGCGLPNGGMILRYNQSTVTVTEPGGLKTEHFFSIRDQGDSSGLFDLSEFGLPFTRGAESGCGANRNELCLSSVAYDCRTGQCVKLRSRYVRYEGETRSTHQWQYRREAASRTVFHDDQDRSVDVVRSAYDGLGHFRTTVTTDSWSGLSRTETTNYNPSRPAVQVDPTTWINTPANSRPPASERWLLGLFDIQTNAEAGLSTTSHTCFDPVTGFLTRRRLLRDSIRNPADVLRVFTADGNGNPTVEEYFGGDTPGQELQNAALCQMSTPAVPRYQISHSYQHGALSRSQYSGATFYSFDADIDANTGLVKTSRETAGPSIAGLATTYSYDLQARMTLAQPSPGHGGRSKYQYSPATAVSDASVLIQQLTNDGTTTLTESKVTFDGLGRVLDDARRLPGGWSTRRTTRNAWGWITGVSELEGTPSHFTQYGAFDVFGRPGTITTPDGSVTTLTYKGVRETTRSVPVQTLTGMVQAVTTETYDGMGRLRTITEKSDNGNPTTTTYGYGSGGQLTSVTMSDQSRAFVYDGRGFLKEETHPESGTTSYKYDARGQLVEQTDANGMKVIRTWDAAARPVKVYRISELSEHLLEEYVYGQHNAGADYRNGRLVEAARHHQPTPGDGDVVVKEILTYAGKGGRVSSRSTALSGHPDVTATFVQSFTHDDAGRIGDLSYPACTAGCTTAGPSRVVRHQYHPNAQELASVSPVGLAVTEVSPSYAPAGGTTVTITGVDFAPGAAVIIGGLAVQENYINPTTMTATLPPLAAGTANDVTVTNPGGTSATLARGLIVGFTDVPAGHIFQPFVEKMFRNEVTSGCTPGQYCPDAPALHSQMAVFVMVGKHGASFVAPPPTGTLFSDVGTATFAAGMIEQLGREEISTKQDRNQAGCPWGSYCPDQQVTRAQMAPMLLRARHGRDYAPPPATGMFTDVSVGSYFAPWIEQLYREGITAGCAPALFCPDAPITRGQMSVFLAAALHLENFPARGYASAITYHSNGMVHQITHANGQVDTWALASHMMARPASITSTRPGQTFPVSWSSGAYGYDGAGNITAIGSDSFHYDLVGRLVKGTARNGTRRQEYTYDRYGNLTGLTTYGPGGPVFRSLPTRASDNRLNTAGTTYDTAGRMLTRGSEQYSHDALGMMRTYALTSPARSLIYFYTTGGERVLSQDVGANSSVFHLRDLEGRVLREFKRDASGWRWQKDSVYRDGALLAVELPKDRQHYHLDHLGTPRLVTGAGGGRRAAHSYYGFGEEAGTNAESLDSRRFTGHERDLTGGIQSDDAASIDYMHARYYSATMGRFLSVDPHLDIETALREPQQWNRYSYVVNNPLKYTDPDGKDKFMAWLLGDAFRDVSTWDALKGVVTGQHVGPSMSEAAAIMGEEHRQMTGGFSPVPTSKTEVAMLPVLMMLGPGGKAAFNGVITSAIKNDNLLVKAAQFAGKSHQSSIDNLVGALAKGNLNPGIGTKNLFGNVMYARSRDGARVFFRQGRDGSVEILAKANKANEKQVIKRLEELYR